MSDESIEQKAMNYETMRHIEGVRNLIGLSVTELLRRAKEHDQEKMKDPEASIFAEFTPKLKTSTYGSPEYNQFLKDMKPALDHHYAVYRHHPEFHCDEWRKLPIDEYYEISRVGALRSINGIVKPNVTPKGYCRVQLRNNKNYFIHRLVMMAYDNKFIDDPLMQINHKNGVKHDNRLENLEWVTASENLQHAYDTELRCAKVKYIVHCIEYDITTYGIDKMVSILNTIYNQSAHSAGIWNAINSEMGEYIGLHFIADTIVEFNPPSNMDSMNLVDLMEMMCDWIASSRRHADGDIYRSIEFNRVRFNMPDMMVNIFRNTAAYLEQLER